MRPGYPHPAITHLRRNIAAKYTRIHAVERHLESLRVALHVVRGLVLLLGGAACVVGEAALVG